MSRKWYKSFEEAYNVFMKNLNDERNENIKAHKKAKYLRRINRNK